MAHIAPSFSYTLNKPSDLSPQIWSMSASELNTARPEWMFGQVEMDSTADFRLLMEGKASNGGFAIDQLIFTPGGCSSK